MKKALLALVLLSTNAAVASPLCPYLEAQISATVASITPISEKKCRVTFTWSKRYIYSPSFQCPLDIDEVSSFGSETAYCDTKVGEELSGVVIRPTDGTPMDIFLY